MDALVEKEKVEELKTEWKKLWQERIDDKFRAEEIANTDYSMLSVEKGTVIFATRDFKMPSFKEILQSHGILRTDRFVSPYPSVGGWGKFIRTVITAQKSNRRVRRANTYLADEKRKQQPKKGGRGWLHY